jgi:hypothetical protein
MSKKKNSDENASVLESSEQISGQSNDTSKMTIEDEVVGVNPESKEEIKSVVEEVKMEIEAVKDEPLNAVEVEVEEEPEPVAPTIDYQSEIDALLTERALLAESATELTFKVEAQEQQVIALQSWAGKQRASFLWKILNRMKNNADEVQAKLDEFQRYVNEIVAPEIGRLHELRKRFHKNLIRAWSVIFILAAIFLYLPKIAERFTAVPQINRFVLSQNYPSNSRIISYAIYALISTLILSLIQYYRDWSAFERNVTVSLWKLDEISKNVNHCREEQARLMALYPQVRDWLEIIGNSLNRPWGIDEKWLDSNLTDIPQDDFPFSLRIAQAQEDDKASSIKLKRDAAERYLIRGWRTKVFEDQVNAAQEMMGMSEDRLNVEYLDADIALSPGGPRAIVREKITDSELLLKVAKRQLIPLMRIVQVESIAAARPPVAENRSDVLQPLKPEEFGLESSTQVPWDEFLASSMGDNNKPRTPLSLLAFSESGRGVGHHDRAKSIFIAPDRLIHRTPKNETTLTQGYSETKRLPMDLVVRMDISGPIPQDDVLILERSKEENSQRISKYQEDIRNSLQGNKSGV